MATEPKESKRAIALVEGPAAQATAQGAAQGASQAAQGKKITEESATQARVVMEKGMEQMTKTAEGFFKAAEEAAEFGRGNLEAMTKAAQTLTVGLQDIGKQVFAVSQALTDQALENAKALTSVRSLKEATDIQTAFARASLERAMAETARLQEATFRLAEQTSAPITARVTLAVEKFGKPIAV